MLEPTSSTASPATAPRRSRQRGDDDTFLARLEAVAKATFYAPGTRVLCPADGRRLVDLAVKLARGRGLDDLTLGEGLAALRAHDLRFGYNGLGDLAREELGIAPEHARWLAGLAEKLAVRPLLRAAVASGELSMRKADAVVDAAVGEHEGYWVERAKHDTVLRLEAVATPGARPPPIDWRPFERFVRPEHEDQVAEALANAATILGNLDAPIGQRLMVMSMEWLGWCPLPEDAAAPLAPEGAQEAVTAAASPPTAAPPSTFAWPRPVRPRKLLHGLKRLVKDRVLEDERLGRACILVKAFAAWKLAGVHGFEAFCVDELGLAPSTVRQRMKLELSLRRLPPLREALRSGALSYEQARAVARVATAADVAERIEAAASRPCIDTQRQVQEEIDRQKWREGRIETWVTPTTDTLYADAMRSLALRVGRPLDPSEGLFLLSAHFNLAWGETAYRLQLAAHPVMKRARGRCEVPGCSHRASHLHHVRYRSRGGCNKPWNLVAVCAAHHLAGIHRGHITVKGTAPDELVWEFPGRNAPEEGFDADTRALEGMRVAA